MNNIKDIIDDFIRFKDYFEEKKGYASKFSQEFYYGKMKYKFLLKSE